MKGLLQSVSSICAAMKKQKSYKTAPAITFHAMYIVFQILGHEFTTGSFPGRIDLFATTVNALF